VVSPDGVAPSWMVDVSACVNLPLHHKVQKFSSGTGSPGWSQKRAVKRLWCGVVWWLVIIKSPVYTASVLLCAHVFPSCYASLIVQHWPVFRICVVVCTGHFWLHIRCYMHYGKVRSSIITWHLCLAKVVVTHRLCIWPVWCCDI